MKGSFAIVSSIFVLYFSAGFCVSNFTYAERIKPEIQSQPEAATYRLFQHAQGGIIYYLDSSKRHGLVAAISDLPSQQQWLVNNTGTYTGAILVELFQGFQNTKLILNSQGTNAPAASSCNSYRGHWDYYSGWYLPSLQELNQMYFLMTEIGGFTTNNAYWSSSENTTAPSQAWAQIFGTSGQQQQPADKVDFASVRCIRAF